MAEIRNPNLQPHGSGGSTGDGMRSTIIMFVLIALVLIGFQFFGPKKQNQTQPSTPPSQTQPVQPAALNPAGAATPQVAAAAPAIGAVAESESTVENDQYKIVLTNRGAQIKHWVLKQYKDSSGHPLDMVQQQSAARFGYPLSLFTYDAGLDNQLKQSLYQVTATGPKAVATGATQFPETDSLTFHYAGNGLDVVKTVRFDQSYVITVEVKVQRNGQPVRALVSWPGGLGDMEEFAAVQSATSMPLVNTSASSQLAWSIAGKQETETASKVNGNATFEQPYEYAGVMDLYFASVFLPDDPGKSSMVTLHNSIDLPSDPSNPNSQKKPASVLGMAVGNASGYTRLRLFAGPKATDVLKAVSINGADGKPSGETLTSLIQYGWFTVIAKPLYLALRYLRNLLGAGEQSWGWAIILFTVVFNLIFLPTRVMVMKSSLKMMRIQPKVESIKRKYAHLKMNDPKRAEMNGEMMQLYRTEGVNMYGSCLPMLPQLPLFFAYYRVLYNAVELRQAHWFWLPDLSLADPWHILPILIIGSMFLIQLMTPSPGMDPNQRRMMAIMMPVIFGFTMWNFASGMALYWATGNLINLGMQMVMNRTSMGREMHAMAAKRAAKKTIPGKR